MILGEASPTSKQLDRFCREAEAAARLQHPNIVQIYEVGEQGGQPFLALELVAGGSLAEKLADTPLPAAEAAWLVETLARAVHHAHQTGIVHRDLKPANILLALDSGPHPPDHRPEGSTHCSLLSTTPKITDFGLAKVVEDGADPSRTGTVLGTPSYMAPEQAAGDRLVGPAADLYALGGILYAALTGRPPFKADTPLNTLQQVAWNEPVPPRQLQPQVPRDLETVCLKCLEKEPGRRYSTALALADDLRRFLDGKPVAARPVRILGRLWRWCRREPALASLAATVFLLLVIAAMGSLVAALLLGKERDVARANEQKADIARQVAVDNERSAHEAQHLALQEAQRADANLAAARKAVEETLTAVAEHPRLKEGDFQGVRKELLSKVLPFYEDFVRQKTDDPKLEAARGWAFNRLGGVRWEMGEFTAGEGAYRAMIEIFARLTAEFPGGADYRSGLARGYDGLGMMLARQDKHVEAEAECRRAVELYARLVAEFPKYRTDLARAYNTLGNVLHSQGKSVEAEPEFRRSLAVHEQLAAEFPAVPGHRSRAAMTRTNLGRMLLEQGKGVAAEVELRRAAELQEQVAADFPAIAAHRSGAAFGRYNLGRLLVDLGQGTKAGAEYRRALEFYEQLSNNQPAVPEYRNRMGQVRTSLGVLFADQGKGKQAEGEYRQAEKVFDKLVKEFPAIAEYRHRLANVIANLATGLAQAGQAAAAEEAYARSLRLADKLVAEAPTVPDYRRIQCLNREQWAWLLAQQGKIPEAEEEFRRTQDGMEKLVDQFPTLPEYLNNLAGLLCTCPLEQLRDPARAVELARRAVERAHKTPATRARSGLLCIARATAKPPLGCSWSR